jgi:hypothetical protein
VRLALNQGIAEFHDKISHDNEKNKLLSTAYCTHGSETSIKSRNNITADYHLSSQKK